MDLACLFGEIAYFHINSIQICILLYGGCQLALEKQTYPCRRFSDCRFTAETVRSLKFAALTLLVLDVADVPLRLAIGHIVGRGIYVRTATG